jgi:hypothetical protein
LYHREDCRKIDWPIAIQPWMLVTEDGSQEPLRTVFLVLGFEKRGKLEIFPLVAGGSWFAFRGHDERKAFELWEVGVCGPEDDKMPTESDCLW